MGRSLSGQRSALSGGINDAAFSVFRVCCQRRQIRVGLLDILRSAAVIVFASGGWYGPQPRAKTVLSLSSWWRASAPRAV
jgi:hypothetical protein